MKYLSTLIAGAGIALFTACGAGHPTIKSLQLNPSQAQGSAPGGEVQFNATGIFENNQSRELSAADGVSWSTSDPTVASIGDTTGQATCNTNGTVTITAKAPADLTLEINNGVHNTSQNVTATATLTCTLTP